VGDLVERLLRDRVVVVAVDVAELEPDPLQRRADLGFGEVALAMQLGRDRSSRGMKLLPVPQATSSSRLPAIPCFSSFGSSSPSQRS
jgi:hypothetical protein